MIYFAFKQLGHEQKGGAESGEERPPLAPISATYSAPAA